MKEKSSTRIIIRLEKNKKYIEKELNPLMMCALFHLQHIIDPDTWETIKLNKFDKSLIEFFKIIEKIDDEYLFGKDEWKYIDETKNK